MELRHLKYFLTVAEEKNFTRAAERLMIAQPPLSRQIRDLEDELGTPLFIREHHSLRLTDEGVLFRDYASRIVALSGQAAADVQNLSRGLHGTLFLAEVEGKGPRLMADWIAGFSRLYPDVQFSLWNGNSDEVESRIRKGLADVAVIMEPFEPQGIHSHFVYEEPWVAMFPADHPLAGDEPIAMKELAGCDLIIPSRDSRLREISDWIGQDAGEPHVIARFANIVTAYELCRQGLGVAIYPEAVKDIVTNEESVRIRTISDKGIRASYALVYSDEHPLSNLALKFVDYVRGLTEQAT